MWGLTYDKLEQYKSIAESKSATESKGRFLSLAVALMSMLLNQSSIIFNVNMSLADIFCMLTFILMVYTKRWKTLRLPLVFFILVTIVTLVTSLFYVPFKYFFAADISYFAVNYIKLAVVFIYFLLGYNLSLHGQSSRILNWFSIAALITATAGLPAVVFNLGPISQVLMYDGVRLIGLMNDPNYYSIIQASALVYISRKTDPGKLKRVLMLVVLAASIFASGSKTGIITLMIYTLFRVFMAMFRKKVKIGSLAVKVLACTLAVVLLVFATGLVNRGIELLSEHIPAYTRVAMVFTDFGSAVSGMGSGRDLTWRVALDLVKESPIIGIGLGTYSDLANQLYGTTVIAHNTYLQLMCEWGIVLTLVLFGFIFIKIIRVTPGRRKLPIETIALRDMLIVFLIGSLAISLNNARMFWLFLGMFIENCSKESIPLKE